MGYELLSILAGRGAWSLQFQAPYEYDLNNFFSSLTMKKFNSLNKQNTKGNLKELLKWTIEKIHTSIYVY